MNHNLVPIPGHHMDQTCTTCAACLRANGDWYLMGIKRNHEPACRPPVGPRRDNGAAPIFRMKHQQQGAA